MFKFTLQKQQGQARAGRFTTPHGVVNTPVFMPVGTHSTLKSLSMKHLREINAQIILANAYIYTCALPTPGRKSRRITRLDGLEQADFNGFRGLSGFQPG
jgi:queuine tRNA-ribosyltransferase